MTGFSDDYADAHDRHWRDAELLFAYPAPANADHLYGLSAECGLKAVLEVEGQPVAPTYRLHVDRLWSAFETFARGRTGAAYLSMLPAGRPFQDWEVGQRYAHRKHFGPACVASHRDAARAVRAMFQSARQGGKP
ncbi:MAG: hypothetical protein OXI22_10505 [Defluviicoccus sp.]|nr:hypothetical protein [Defluviicoccus sp.]MDE0384306.1 hypothetical protein [Defluviicoccus sp.]